MPGIEVQKNTCRKRQKDPKKFDKRSFRTKKVSEKTSLVVGCPQGKYDSKKKKCKVGTQVQSVIKKKNKDGTCPSF